MLDDTDVAQRGQRPAHSLLAERTRPADDVDRRDLTLRVDARLLDVEEHTRLDVPRCARARAGRLLHEREERFGPVVFGRAAPAKGTREAFEEHANDVVVGARAASVRRWRGRRRWRAEQAR